eukprot:TRINITY_DN1307_c0_g1_i6.p1 TRINITY_DN1307_c0_g1~~TRINITY_DN1307_c0_g1_i6.p1  ORF type:complete len:230 (-),score=43.05 TRINITY_DN1307_c0_g1_i6:183-872(-)
MTNQAINTFFFFNDTATTEIYTEQIVGSVRCVQETARASTGLLDMDRKAHRVLKNMYYRNFEQTNADKNRSTKIKSLIEVVEKNIERLCCETLRLLDALISRDPISLQARIFYMKMKREAYCTIGEYSEGMEREAALKKGFLLSNDLLNIAFNELGKADPLRLSIVLRHGVMLYQTINREEEAMDLLRHAHEEGMRDIEDYTLEERKSAVELLVLIRDTIQEWKDANGE